MKNAWGTNEKEPIYGIRNSINFLSCDCVRLMFFLEQQNLIKSKCWVHERIHLVCIRCISMHLNVRTIANTHSIFGAGGRLVWVSIVHLKSLWYEKLRSSVCTVQCALQMKRIQIAMMNRTQQYFNWLSAFVRQTYIKAYAHAHTSTQYWRITNGQNALYAMQCNAMPRVSGESSNFSV